MDQFWYWLIGVLIYLGFLFFVFFFTYKIYFYQNTE